MILRVFSFKERTSSRSCLEVYTDAGHERPSGGGKKPSQGGGRGIDAMLSFGNVGNLSCLGVGDWGMGDSENNGLDDPVPSASSNFRMGGGR